MILAHYYQEGEIQDLADFVGDSLDLSRKAAATDADVIVFCGVRFMGEVAKILAPSCTVLIPDAEAGCSLEESCRSEVFGHFRDRHPDHIAVTYINCSAAVKALSDVIVTSSNAEAILRQLPADRPILFAPDRHLGAYLQRMTGRAMTLWPGTCIVHEQFSERELIKLKMRHPDALVAAHPECPAGVLSHADHIGSTRAILEFVLNANGSGVYHRHRTAHHPPDAEGCARQGLPSSPGRRWRLQLLQLSVYGPEHARKDLSVFAQQRAANRVAGASASGSSQATGENARYVGLRADRSSFPHAGPFRRSGLTARRCHRN